MTFAKLGIISICIFSISNVTLKAEEGIASVYCQRENRTASGEMLNCAAMTAAHKTLPFGTKISVTNLKNGKTVLVRINDRGPFVPGRVIDLTTGAGRVIGLTGITRVRVE